MRNLILISAAFFALAAHAFSTAKDAFVGENGEVFNSLSLVSRYEMINNYEAGNKAGVMNNLHTDESRITYLDDNRMTVSTSSAQTVELTLIPKSKKDTVIAVIETVLTPVPDSRLSFFDASWNPLETSDFIVLPEIADFILPSAPRQLRDNLLAEEELVMIDLHFEDNSIVAHCDLRKSFIGENFNAYAPFVRDTLVYQLKKGKFKLQN